MLCRAVPCPTHRADSFHDERRRERGGRGAGRRYGGTWINYMSDAVVYIDTILSVAPAASLIRVGWKARQLTGPIL